MDRATLFIAIAIVGNGMAGLAGGLMSERWLARHLHTLVGFAAGALLTAVFLDILPEALEAFGPASLALAFASFVVLALAEWSLGHHHRLLVDHAVPAPVPAALLFSDALHNVGDGAAVAAAFLISPAAGAGTALAVMAHELPQEVGDYALLRAAGYSRARALAALAGVQLTSALGAGAVVVGAEHVHRLTGAVLAIAAGTFLYIGATDLLPEVHSGHDPKDRRRRMLGFLGGLLLLLLVSVVAGRA